MGPRVLVDATGVPADRGALGRYVDGLVSALSEAGADLALACQRADEERYAQAAARRQNRSRTARHRASAGQAGVGAERSAARRDPGRRRRHSLAALLDAAAARPAHRGDHSRPDVLHRAGHAQSGDGDVLQGGDQYLGVARDQADRSVQGHQGRAGPGARSRLDQDRRGLPRRGSLLVPQAGRGAA